MITEWAFYLTAIPAVLIYGIGKGGLGGALGVIAVPLMTMTVSPLKAAAILLPILCVMDIFAVKQHYLNMDRAVVKRMLPGALLGVAIAGLFLSVTPVGVLKVLIGGLSLLFCFQYMLKRESAGRKPGRLSAWLWSFLSGFSSTAIHAGGGPASIYLLPLRLEKVTLIATMAVLFGILNLVKLLPFALLGEFNQTNLLTALVLMPLAPVGVKVGVWMLHRVSQRWVYRLCYLFLLISGIRLFVDGIGAVV